MNKNVMIKMFNSNIFVHKTNNLLYGVFMKSRLEIINTYIQSKGEVRLADLNALDLHVSDMTLRRYLTQLEQEGLIIRTRGGARSIASLSKSLLKKEEVFSRRMLENPDGKQLLANKAVSLVQKGQSIYIDAGTTCTCFAKELPDISLSVLTNAPNIAIELASKKNISISLVGGQLSNENLSTSGAGAHDFVKNINIDMAFIAASGFSTDSGFTTGNAAEADLKRTILNKARKSAILMDHTKQDRIMTYTFAHLSDVDYMVCDGELSEAVHSLAAKSKTKIL